MGLIIDKIETKVEFFEAYDLKTLERHIEEQVDKNKALMLDVHSVTHQVAFDPNRNKMHYSAVVHYRSKQA